MKSFIACAVLASSYALVSAKSQSEWQQRSVYQLLTDRYYKTNGDVQKCNDLSKYCGGTFAGITEKLDYI
jgi:alpha-amylase